MKRIKKKQFNARISPGTFKQIEELQLRMAENGFSVSQGDVIEEAIRELHQRTFAKDSEVSQ